MRKTLIATAMLLMAAPTLATNAVTSFTGGTGYGFFRTDETIGWTFSTASSIVVTGLGWNVGSGSNSDHVVGLWNNAGTLLGSATITAGEATDGIWRFTAVSPISLVAGQYFIGGRDTANDGDGYVSGVDDLALASGLTYIGSAVSREGSGFAFPSRVNTITTGGRFGANFQFDAGVVPEPESWAMLIAGFGLVGAAARRRRRAIA